MDDNWAKTNDVVEGNLLLFLLNWVVKQIRILL